MPELKPLELELLDTVDGVRTVRARGCLSDNAAAAATLETLLGADCFASQVTLDLNHVDFIDSSGIGWLLGAHRRFRSAGGGLVLHSIPPVVRQTLKVLRMDEVLRLAKDESAARSLVRGETVV
jgi:anti-sigma B factor antagonist